MIDASFAGALGAEENDFVAGCDRFRHGNAFEDERLTLNARGDYVFGEHLISGGIEVDQYDLFNIFASDILGTFRFDNLQDLQNGVADVTLRGAPTDVAAEWGYTKLSLFAQDEWQVLPNLSLNAGLRYERFLQDDEPLAREDFIGAVWPADTDSLDGIDIIQPRFGFRYEPLDRTVITGGFGLFAGGEPHVWISNAYQPQIFEVSEDDVNGGDRFTGVDPRNPPAELVQALANADPSTPTFIDVIAPDFEIPSTWKASVRVQQEFDAIIPGTNFSFGDDYLFTSQLLYQRVKDGFRWENIAQTQLDATQQLGVAPDGRPIYANLESLGIDNAIELTNFSGGESLIFSLALAKQYENGFGFDVSYAYQDVDSTTPGTSSRGVSNYRAMFTADRNNPASGRAPFELSTRSLPASSYEKRSLVTWRHGSTCSARSIRVSRLAIRST